MAADRQERRRIVVDGSNIATEGRTVPSLAQLDEAIRSFLDEYQGFATSDVTVVVDASFGHRIDPSEVPAFQQALDHGEMITPPAGALGRGDGFILRIAEKSGALVLSNDSFQEFHADRPWLFEAGRLIGGKPVPGVGWVFTPRTPVRGARSRTTTTRSRRDGSSAELGAAADSDGIASASVKKGATKKKAAKASQGSESTKATKSTKAGLAERAAKSGRAEKSADRENLTKTDVSSTKTTKAAKLATTGKSAGAKKAAEPAGAKKAAKVASARNGRAPTRDNTTADGKPAKSKVAKVAKVAKEPTAADGKAAASPAKEAKEAKATKADKAAKAGKSAKVTKAGKSAKASRATKGAKASKATKAAKPAQVSSEVRSETPTGADTATYLNDPVTFLTFVANHPVGSTFDGTVASFTSHGAHIDVDGMLCHVPLRGLGDPPPTRARQVLTKGETRPFVLVSVDAARRRAALALPDLSSR